MGTKLLVMGRKQNYHEAEASRACLQKEVSKMSGWLKGEELLYNLRSDNKIPADQLRNYGATISLKEGTVASETIMDGLERFFEKAHEYAEKYNTSYVLIQELKISQKYRTFDINGLAQLLIK